jgi:hypothetical protein
MSVLYTFIIMKDSETDPYPPAPYFIETFDSGSETAPDDDAASMFGSHLDSESDSEKSLDDSSNTTASDTYCSNSEDEGTGATPIEVF